MWCIVVAVALDKKGDGGSSPYTFDDLASGGGYIGQEWAVELIKPSIGTPFAFLLPLPFVRLPPCLPFLAPVGVLVSIPPGSRCKKLCRLCIDDRLMVVVLLGGGCLWQRIVCMDLTAASKPW